MRIFIEPHKDQWPFLVKRVRRDDSTLDWRVTAILHRVKEGGDAALINVITEIEGQAPSRLKVTPEEFYEAEKLVPDEIRQRFLKRNRGLRLSMVSRHLRVCLGMTAWG